MISDIRQNKKKVNFDGILLLKKLKKIVIFIFKFIKYVLIYLWESLLSIKDKLTLHLYNSPKDMKKKERIIN